MANCAEAGCRVVAGDAPFEHVFVGLAADGLACGMGDAAAVVMDDGVALFAVEADCQIAGCGGGSVGGSGRSDNRGGGRGGVNRRRSLCVLHNVRRFYRLRDRVLHMVSVVVRVVHAEGRAGDRLDHILWLAADPAEAGDNVFSF